MDNLIGRKVRRELQVELPDGSAGTEVLVGTVTSYSRESTYYEVDYNDGGEPEEFTREELIPMLVPQPPPRPGGSGDGRAGSAAGAMVAGGGSRGGSSGSTSAAAQLGGTLRTPSPGGYMTEMELRAGVSAEVAAMERLIGRKVKHTVTRRVEGPGGGGSDETFEALGFVSLYSPANDLFTVEFEDGGEETFSPTALDRILMPEEMVRIEAELREEREAVLREREKVRVAEEAISDEANAKEAAQLAKLAERREAVRAQEVKEEVQRLEIEQGEQDQAFEEEKAKRDAELLEELKKEARAKEAAAMEATKATKEEMAVLKHLIEQANKTALDIKKDKMLVKREITELAKQQKKLASRLTDDERAIMDMAQQVDENLRARVREIRTRAEADIAEVQQSTLEEEALIRRMQENLDDEEERETVEAAQRLRDMQIHSHVNLHDEIKKQLQEKASMERDAVVVRASMQSFQEQVKQHEAFLMKYEMGTRNLRLELEEERTKANQHTIEKIGFLARDMQRAKDALHLHNERLKTVQAAMEPLIDKVGASAQEASAGLLECKKAFEEDMAEVRDSVKTSKKRVKQDVKLMREAVEQDLLEIRAAMIRRNRAAQSSSCRIA